MPVNPPAPVLPVVYRNSTVECESCGAQVHPKEVACSYCKRVVPCHQQGAVKKTLYFLRNTRSL